MSFLPHKKFTWADFGGYIPPSLRPWLHQQRTSIYLTRLRKATQPTRQRYDTHFHRRVAAFRSLRPYTTGLVVRGAMPELLGGSNLLGESNLRCVQLVAAS